LRIAEKQQEKRTPNSAILNLGELLSGSAPHREDIAGTTMMPKRSAAKFDPADLAM
jgi:hypothetical protein